MKLNPIARLFKGGDGPAARLMAIAPPRAGGRALLGVENLLGSIAVLEPVSLEIVGDSGSLTISEQGTIPSAPCRMGPAPPSGRTHPSSV